MKYQTLNHILINTQHLKHNYCYYQKANPQAAIAPVLKANAYGHGLTLIGKWIDQNLKVPFICVDSLFEAYELTKAGIKTPLLILGYTDPINFKVWKKLANISFPVFDQETLIMLNKHQPGAKIHLKIDTGMNRLGIQPSRAGEWFKLLKRYNQVQIEGIYSHLSQSDDPDKVDFTKNQIQSFKQVIHEFESRGVRFKWKHISATAAATPFINCHSEPEQSSSVRIPSINNSNLNHLTDPTFNLIRLGLGFYGYTPFPTHLIKSSQALRTSRTLHTSCTLCTSRPHPALTLTSRLAQIKRVEKGSQISYGGTFKAKKDMTIGVLPIGYSDGFPRSLSNQAQFTITSLTQHQKSNIKDLTPLPTLGRICMNMTIIDLTSSPFPRGRLGGGFVPSSISNPPITIISPNPHHPNSVYNLAKLAGTIPYEILTNLNPTIRRSLI